MLMSQKHNFIFVHNHKTAGLSIENKLTSEIEDLVFWQDRHDRVISGIEQIGLAEWSSYFSFAFVRNPWDRLVSWYAMIVRARQQLPPGHLSAAPFDNALWNYALLHAHDFESFVRNCTAAVDDRGCIKSFAFNQVDYLSDAQGVIRVNFIGRYEHLARDCTTIFRKLGLNDVELPSLNVSHHTHYSSWYTPQLRDIVAKRFERDIAAFNYQFEVR